MATPAGVIEAMAASETDHEMARPEIVAPLLSSAVAVKVDVAPTNTVFADEPTETLATCGREDAVEPSEPPQAARTISAGEASRARGCI